MFKRILAATDMVTACDAPVVTGVRIAEQNSATLHVLHILESASTEDRHLVKHFETGNEMISTPEYETLVKETIERNCADIVGSDYDLGVTTGFPWEEILRCSTEKKIDLILMGPHAGKAEEKGVIRVRGKIGSTVEGVLMRELCPLLIVNQPIPKEKLKFQRIMACIDFSKSCECALYFGIKLAKEYSAKLTVFHMLPVPPYPKYSSENYEADLNHLNKKLEAFCKEEIPGGIEHDFHVWGGALPHQEILKCAAQTEADLIIMGSHTKEKSGKWYAGSAVERVSFRSDCPVMVVTAPDALIEWGDDNLESKIESRKDAERLICVYTKKQS